MVTSKSAAADPAESSNENKRTCGAEGGTTSLISDELCCDYHGIWSALGEEVATNLPKSVVTIVLSDGHNVLFASSGVAIERRWNLTRFVTTASLVEALQHHSDAKIEVRYEGKVFIGVVEEYVDHEIAFVKTMTALLDVYCIPLNHVVEWTPETKVVALARDVFGKLMATSGQLGYSDGYNNGEAGGYLIMLLTCKLPEGWTQTQGGAVFDFDGNFVGMMLVFDMERVIIMPMITILELRKHLRTPQRSRLPFLFQDVKHYSRPQAYEDVPSNAQSKNGSRGYHPSTSRDTINRDIALLNAHHGPFGDVYPQGVWGEFNISYSLSLSKSVVALASFNGGTKFFSCTGFFINFDDECQTILTSATLVRDPDGSNKIVEGLKIKVLLPNNQIKEGELKHCSLQYNVALVSVKNCRCVRHVNLDQCSVNFSSKVVAVGRSFESRALMATRGEQTCWSGPFDCEDLSYSTCKISKVGIGGPLVDIDGKFLGLNYYDKKMGTPFLDFDVLRGIMQYFKTKKTKYRSMIGKMCHILEDNDCSQNQWILPDPSSMDKREREEERKVLASLRRTRRRRIQYAYRGGFVSVLKSRLPFLFQDVKHYSRPQAYEDVPSNAQSKNGSRGYHPSTSRDTINRNIALLNAHHGPFGDAYPQGVWGEFNISYSLSLSKSVVALASFNGGTKFFSCTGFFINFDDECQTILTSATLVRDPDGSNKIVEGLKIKVLLPNNQSKEGELKHCSLQYNVALVSVKNCRYVRHVNLEQCSVNFSSKVVAVGRSFESRALMATRGQRTCWSGPFDCQDLSYSTCKISKVGIGGPLVDIDGKFLGMNYYDKKMGTPFLYFDVLRGILQYFKTKETKYRSMVGKMCHIREDNDCSQNQWILPDPSSMDKREREEERKVLASLRKTRRRRIQYAYRGGFVSVLK